MLLTTSRPDTVRSIGNGAPCLRGHHAPVVFPPIPPERRAARLNAHTDSTRGFFLYSAYLNALIAGGRGVTPFAAGMTRSRSHPSPHVRFSSPLRFYSVFGAAVRFGVSSFVVLAVAAGALSGILVFSASP